MRKFGALVLVVIWFMVAAVPCWALGLEVAAGVWQEDPSGHVAYKGESLSTDELGLDQETKVYGRAKLDLPFLNLYLMVTPVRFEGTGQKTGNFTFGDQTFSARVPFNSELEMNQYDLGIYWGIPLLKSATKVASLGNLGFNLEFGLDIKVLDLYAKITQNAVSADKSLTVPVPMLYLGAGLEVWKLSLEAEGRGVTYDGHYFYDAIARVKFVPFSFPLMGKVFLEGGYRYQKIKINDISDIIGEIELSGPFVGIGGAF